MIQVSNGAALSRPLCTSCLVNESSVSHKWCSECLANAKRQRYARYVSEGRCKKCGEPNDNTTNKLCSSCFEKYKADQRRRKRERKTAAVKLLGGKCVDCGIESPHMEIYDFHHKDRNDKESGIASLLQNNWDKVLAELKKCELLCANCHRIREHRED